MIGIIDYGVGNVYSLCSSLHSLGAEVNVSNDPQLLRRADQLILPGVGAFADAAYKLSQTGLDTLIREQVNNGVSLLGICLGMQLLFDRSEEFGIHAGLGLIPGVVVAMQGRIPADLKIPHIGWNALHITRNSSLLRGIQEGDCVYFVHSFFASDCAQDVIATTEYGCPITAAVQKGNLYGCQFHPEKSGKVGLAILRAFCEGDSV